MSELLPPQVSVSELPDGVEYRLPPRRLGQYHWLGYVLVLLGLTLTAAPLWPGCKVLEVLQRQAPLDEGMGWLFLLMFSLLPGFWGLSLARIGLFVLAGHSEIRLTGGTLTATECCGLVRRTRSRPAADLRRFFVSQGLASWNLAGLRPEDPLGALSVITPEWKPAVGGKMSRPFWLAPGYPRDWLLALAHDLAARSSPAEADAPAPACDDRRVVSPTVMETGPDFSDYEELTEQPTGSTIEAWEEEGTLTLVVPPPGYRNGSGQTLAGLFVCLAAFAFSQHLFMAGNGNLSDLALAGLAGLVWAAGILLILAGRSRARQRVELSVRQDALSIWQSGLLGGRCQEWPREHLADVFVLHDPGDAESQESWHLQIHPKPGQGEWVRLLHGCDGNELRWLATVLRRALHLAGDSSHSPPPGRVVKSDRARVSSALNR